MLSDTLHKHLDEMDKLEEQMQDDIDKAIATIDIDALMANPKATLDEVSNIIEKFLVNKYAHLALKHGSDLAKIVQKKDIIVDASKNPTVNEDAVSEL